MTKLAKVVGCTTALSAVAVYAFPTPASSEFGSDYWEGNVDENTSYHGNQTVKTFQYLSHAYYNNPVQSTLAAVTCSDHALLGSFFTVAANSKSLRHLTEGRVGPNTCWKVRVRNQVNTSTYFFNGVQYSSDTY